MENEDKKEKEVILWNYIWILAGIGIISVLAIWLLPKWLDDQPEDIIHYNKEIDSLYYSMSSSTFTNLTPVMVDGIKLLTDPTKLKIEKEKSSRETIIQICTGILAMVGVYLTIRRTKALEDQNKINDKNYKALKEKMQYEKEANVSNLKQLEEKNINEKADSDRRFILELFSKASELLMSTDIAGRLSGIYMFEKIMNESEEYHWPIIELLTAFVRENRSVDKYFIDEKPHLRNRTRMHNKKVPAVKEEVVSYFDEKYDKEKKEYITIEKRIRKVPVEKDIQAIVTVLGKRETKFENDFITNNQTENSIKKYINLSRTNLFGAEFTKGKFEWFNFSKSILINSNCKSAHFEYAHCWLAHFDNAHCWLAHFDNTHCSFAYFEYADCKSANFEGTDFRKADFKATSNLTVEQLLKAKTLRGVTNLDPKIEEKLKEQKPEWFEEPAQNDSSSEIQ